MSQASLDKKDEAEAALGGRLRTLRSSRGLSLRSLAGMVGITPGAVSQIETGEISPSLSTLRKLLKALGTSLSEFFACEQQESSGGGLVFRASQLTTLTAGKGVKFLGMPGPGSHRLMQILYEVYSPKYGDTGDAPYSHEGEEGGFCIAGTIEMTVGDRRELLGPGDAYYYSSKIPHRWRNVGKVPAVVVSACTPPGVTGGAE